MLSAEPVCSCAHLFVHFAHETAGAARTRLSLRPLYFGGQRSCKASGVSRREIMEPCLQAKPSPSSPVPVIPVARGVGLASDIDFAITSRNELLRVRDRAKNPPAATSKPGGFHGQYPRSRHRSGISGGAGGYAGWR